jgi:lipoic acid synthetase
MTLDPSVAPAASADPEPHTGEKTPDRLARQRKPSWLKVRAPGGAEYRRLKQTLRRLDLHTVCEEARCPNVGECWAAGTATVMILGDLCTRGCRFCAVKTGHPRGAVDPREPEHVARALSELGLQYAVLTMVNRDDLLDGGAEHVAATVRALKRRRPEMLVETLVGDFQGRRESIATVVAAVPDVFAHNLEVTRALTPKIRDPRCGYDRSLDVLRQAKAEAPERLTKSSLMVGLGEREEEIFQALSDLRGAQVDIVTIGQYLQPSPRHASVVGYVTPEQFAAYEREGKRLGFQFVASGPLVRSSYHAAEAFVATLQGNPLGSRPGVQSRIGAPGTNDGEGTAAPGEFDGATHEPPDLGNAQGEHPAQLIHPSALLRR